jgi:hypothetical protein
MIIAAFDPGAYTGCAIFDGVGRLTETGTVKDDGTLAEYCDKLRKMQERHSIDIAIIEAYQNFGKHFRDASKVQAQIRALQDVFTDYIMVRTGSWNPRHYDDRFKRSLAASAFRQVFTNSHTTDAALMGAWFCAFMRAASQRVGITPEEMVAEAVKKWHKIPTDGDIIMLRDEMQRNRKPSFTVGTFHRAAV